MLERCDLEYTDLGVSKLLKNDRVDGIFPKSSFTHSNRDAYAYLWFSANFICDTCAASPNRVDQHTWVTYLGDMTI